MKCIVFFEEIHFVYFEDDSSEKLQWISNLGEMYFNLRWHFPKRAMAFQINWTAILKKLKYISTFSELSTQSHAFPMFLQCISQFSRIFNFRKTFKKRALNSSIYSVGVVSAGLRVPNFLGSRLSEKSLLGLILKEFKILTSYQSFKLH